MNASEPKLRRVAEAIVDAGNLPPNGRRSADVAIRAVAELKANLKLGHAEALLISMRGLIEEGATFEAHPSLWAPFVLVGEGGR